MAVVPAGLRSWSPKLSARYAAKVQTLIVNDDKTNFNQMFVSAARPEIS
jgi:hypothetical protein